MEPSGVSEGGAGAGLGGGGGSGGGSAIASAAASNSTAVGGGGEGSLGSNNGGGSSGGVSNPGMSSGNMVLSTGTGAGGAASQTEEARPSPLLPPGASSASSTPIPSPSASSPVTGQAKDAALLFQAQRYPECLRMLDHLLQKKEDDVKVLHNVAVAEYYRDDCTDPQRLLDVLAKVKRRSEELASANDDQLEGTMIANIEDYDASVPTLNIAVIYYHLQQYETALSVLEPLYENIEPIDEAAALRVCLLMLDITLASGQPGKAAGVLQTMEKTFGYLLSPGDAGNPTHSQPPIQPQPLNAAGAGLSSADGSNVLSSGGSSSLINSPSGEAGLTRTSSEEVLDEDALSLSLDVDGSHSVRNVTPLPLPTSFRRSRLASVEKILPAPVVDLKLMLHLYKVRLLMLTSNLKATKREVKSALNLSRDHLTALVLKAQLEYSRANYRKAIKLLTTWNSRAEPGMRALFLSNLGCIHHQLGKYQTASLFFSKALQANTALSKESPTKLNTFSQDKSLSILYNAGLQQLISGNPTLAARCFQEAGLLYYNQPLLWLRLAECCISALERGSLVNDREFVSPHREDIQISVIGDGRWRCVVLPAGSLNPSAAYGPNIESSEGEERAGPDGPLELEKEPSAPVGPQKLSLAYARQCLYTALHLLNKRDAKAAETAPAVLGDSGDVSDGEDATGTQLQKNGAGDKRGASTSATGAASSQVSPNGDGKESKGATGNSGTIKAAVASYEEDRKKQRIFIRQSILGALAYVELTVQNPLQAFKVASELLSLPDCSQLYAFLARLYAAEALCLLNRSREAADYLLVCLSENSNDSTNGNEDEGQKWKSGENSEASGDGEESIGVSPYALPGGTTPEAFNVAKLTGSRARSSLYVNLAAVWVMQGDLDQAHNWATQAVSLTPANPIAVLAVVYVNLLKGQREEAINMLKQCRHLCVVHPNKALWQSD